MHGISVWKFLAGVPSGFISSSCCVCVCYFFPQVKKKKSNKNFVCVCVYFFPQIKKKSNKNVLISTQLDPKLIDAEFTDNRFELNAAIREIRIRIYLLF
jgi:hypothetical protein